MLNRFLLSLLKMRGIKITKTEQDNTGGNADHYNLLYRAKSKEKSKSSALKSFLDESDATPKVSFNYTGEPSGHKNVHLRIEGEIFGRTPISISAHIEDEISINGASTVVDAIRIVKCLIDFEKQEEVDNVCASLMKMPPKPMSDSKASEAFEAVLKKFNNI